MIERNGSFAQILFQIAILCAVGVARAAVVQGDYHYGDDSVNVLVIGDWGGLPVTPYTTAVERAIAHQMGKFATSHGVQFVLALGDNFYFDGVSDVDDPRFQETYDAVFSEPALSMDWYLIAGNHDHNGNVSAQIEYSTREKRWRFPKPYYALQFPLPSGSGKVDIIMLDTVLLCGNSDDDVLGLQPNGPRSRLVAEEQWAWLEAQLQNSSAKYLLVAGHYPVLSISSHGPTKCLTTRLMPLLHKYAVTAYLCGHDHNLQHLEYTASNSTVQYFLSGAANFIDDAQTHKGDVPPGSSKFFWADTSSLGGYGFVRIDASQLEYSFYDASGSLLYSRGAPPRWKQR